MAWLDNPYREANFQQYKMTKTEFDTLFSFCQNPKSSKKEVHNLCVEFWRKLGETHGFDPWSVSRVNHRNLTFEAVPEK